MRMEIKNKKELDAWIFKQLASGASVVSVRDGSRADDFIDPDGTIVKLPVNTAWKNIMTGEVFQIEYDDQA